MNQASQNPTKMVVPQKFEYVSPSNGIADITIKLVSQRNGDGYSGYSQSTVDKNQMYHTCDHKTVRRKSEKRGRMRNMNILRYLN